MKMKTVTVFLTGILLLFLTGCGLPGAQAKAATGSGAARGDQHPSVFEVRVTEDDGIYSLFPSTAWTGSEYGIAWQDNRDGMREIYFARLNKNGVKIGNETRISANDGYSTVLDYEQVTGDFITYNPDTMKEVGHGELNLILMYELDGRIPTHEEGKPVRLAIAGEDYLLTEGLYWVKWVEKIEVIRKDKQGISEGK